MGQIATVPSAGAVLFIRTSDHCPPHLHAANTQRGWEIRIFFSYASIEIGFNIKWGKPSKAEIAECMEEAWARIDDCRAQWWDTFKTVCLDNKQVEIKSGVLEEVPLQKRPRRAKSGKNANKPPVVPAVLTVASAAYRPAMKSIDFTAVGTGAKYTGQCP